MLVKQLWVYLHSKMFSWTTHFSNTVLFHLLKEPYSFFFSFLRLNSSPWLSRLVVTICGKYLGKKHSFLCPSLLYPVRPRLQVWELHFLDYCVSNVLDRLTLNLVDMQDLERGKEAEAILFLLWQDTVDFTEMSLVMASVFICCLPATGVWRNCEVLFLQVLNF